MKKSILLFLCLTLGSVLCAKTVKLSDFKPDRNDAHPAIQAAIDSGAATVIIDNPGFNLLIKRAIRLQSNQTIIFKDGVVLEAAANYFKSLGEPMFSATNLNNVTLRGEGKVVLKMRKKDYQNPSLYNHSEWRHLLNLKGCENVTIKNLTLLASGGDGIYVAASPEKVYCKNILCEDLIISDHHRQAISVISAENLTVRRCTLSNTSGTGPANGIDFEPNHKPFGQRIINNIIEDCIISGNDSYGIGFATVNLEGGRPPMSVIIRRCRVFNNRGGITFNTSHHRFNREKVMPPSGFIKVQDCVFENNTAASVRICDHIPTIAVTFENCSIRSTGKPGDTPFAIAVRRMRGFPVGNVEFKNVVCYDADPEKLFTFHTWTDAYLVGIRGDITIDNKGKKSKFDLDEYILNLNREISRRNKYTFIPAQASQKNFTTTAKSTFTTEKGTASSRGRFWYVFYARKGEKVAISLERNTVSGEMELSLKAKNNKVIASGKIVRGKKKCKFNFTAPVTGPYMITGNSRAAILKIDANVPGGWMLMVPQFFAGKKIKLFFNVPEKLKEFEIRACGRFGNPPFQAKLISPDGKTAAQNDAILEPYCFQIKKAVPGVWAIEIDAVSEKHLIDIQLGKGLENLLSLTPEVPAFGIRKAGKKKIAPAEKTEVKSKIGDFTGDEN